MKKILSVILLMSFLPMGVCNLAFGEENNSSVLEEVVSVEEIVNPVEKDRVIENEFNDIQNLSTAHKKLNKKEYKRSTIYKHYVPYEVTFKNTGVLPILMTTQTEIEFITDNDTVIKSDSRRYIYNRTRKRDRGRHYALQVPGVFLGVCVSVGTFMLGTPLGYGVYKAMQYPTIKAARTNVNIAQDLYSDHGLPLRFEPNVEYGIYFYAPKTKDKKNPISLKSIRIKNVSLNNELKDIEVPLVNSTPVVVEKTIVPVDVKNEENVSDKIPDTEVAEEE